MTSEAQRMQTQSFESSIRLAHRIEIENRWVANEVWRPIWTEAGIKLAHHAMPDVPNSGHSPSAPMAQVHGVELGRVGHGDLVAVYGEGVPDDVNQHLRRVVSTVPDTDGSGRMTLLLGPKVQREMWPVAMLRETVPIALEVQVKGTTVCAVRGTETVEEFPATERDVGVWKGYVEAMLTAAARAGKRDGLSEQMASFSAKPAQSSSGARIWEVRDHRGRVYASDSRNILNRRVPKRVESLVQAVRYAYHNARMDAAYEDRMASQMTDPGVGDDGGPGESEHAANAYGGP